MKNDKFWDECTPGSIREKAAEFIDNNPAISHLENQEYYDFEDALIQFIYENRDLISQEVDLEYQRDDFLAQAKEEFGKEAEEAVKVLPLRVIDKLVQQWQKAIDNNSDYWDTVWGELTDVLTDSEISPLAGLDDYPANEVLIYVAYLKEWYTDMPPEMQEEEPACIEDFFNNEMADEQLSEYYLKIAKKLFGDKIKG